MKNKKWLRSVAFILLLCVAVAGVLHCYSQPKYFNTRFINTFDECYFYTKSLSPFVCTLTKRYSSLFFGCYFLLAIM